MKRKDLKIPILLLVVLLIVVLTLTALGFLNPLYFWILTIPSAVFAFVVLPRVKK